MTLRRTLLVATGVVLLLAAVLAWLGVRGLSAQRHLESARADLQAARVALLDRRTEVAGAALAAAGQETAQARRLTGDPVWAAAAHVPLAGRSLAVVRGLVVGADDLARGVLPPLLDTSRTLDPRALRRPDGTVDLALLARVAPGLHRAAGQAQDVRARVDGLPTSGVPGVVRRARTELAGQLDELAGTLTGADDAVEVAPALLGGDRPRRYFVLVQQPGESRGTGGLPGGFAVLQARAGRLTVVQEGNNDQLLNVPVPPPTGLPAGYVDRYDVDGAFAVWQNVNYSPDLPAVAKVVASRWQAQSGQRVDGVITLDPTSLQALLQGAPPLALGGGRTLATDQVERYLLLDQYVGQQPGDGQGARKDQLVVIARAAAAQLTGGAGDSTALLRGLTASLRTGHLRMASDDPALHPVLARTGVDGALPQGAAPVAYPVLVNTGGSKLDQFVDRTVRYDAGACSGARRDSTVTVTLRNQAPPVQQLPAYVTSLVGDGAVQHSSTDAVALSVYVTRGATLTSATLDGRPVVAGSRGSGAGLEAGDEQGLPVWRTYLDLAPAQPRVLVLHLSEPTASGAARVPVQPLTRDLVTLGTVLVC